MKKKKRGSYRVKCMMIFEALFKERRLFSGKPQFLSGTQNLIIFIATSRATSVAIPLMIFHFIQSQLQRGAQIWVSRRFPTAAVWSRSRSRRKKSEVKNGRRMKKRGKKLRVVAVGLLLISKPQTQLHGNREIKESGEPKGSLLKILY